MKSVLLAAVAATIFAAPALAQNTTVTTLDGSQGFVAPAGELRPQPNPTSSATITANPALDADGSLQLSGLRTRVLNGDNYGATTNYGLANDLVSFTADYLVTNGSPDGIQSPAFRVYIQDGTQRSELIYEASNNNGGYTLGEAESVTANSLFYQNIAGSGPTFLPGTSTYLSLTLEAFGNLYSSNAFITAFGVGNGGCPTDCTNFNAFADNLALTLTGGRTNAVNFASSAVAAVPEPATWAMMLMGFGAMGFALRRRKRTSNILQAA